MSCFMNYYQIGEHADSFGDKLLGHYALTKYFLAYAVAEIIKDSAKGRALISEPSKIITSGKADEFIGLVSNLAATTIDDMEAEISELRQDGGFDHKRDLKSPKWCRNMANKLKAAYKKDVKRKKAVDIDDLFKDF